MKKSANTGLMVSVLLLEPRAQKAASVNTKTRIIGPRVRLWATSVKASNGGAIEGQEDK
jgi:hypothetical protein